jgi:hypothetical protein
VFREIACVASARQSGLDGPDEGFMALSSSLRALALPPPTAKRSAFTLRAAPERDVGQGCGGLTDHRV